MRGDGRSPPRPVSIRLGDWAQAAAAPPATDAGLEIVFRPDPSVGDGRFANNGWLQELPKPLTKLTWDNAVIVEPAHRAALGIKVEETSQGHVTEVVELQLPRAER